jgi:hypothetical protein
MPVFTSVAIKLVSHTGKDGGEVALVMLILILVPFVYLIGEYHLL